MTGTSTRAICSLKSFLDITLFEAGCVNGSRVPPAAGTTQSACVFLFPIREATEVLIVTYHFLVSVFQGDRREHTQELSRPHRRMHRCWKRATLTRTSDRTQSWRCNAGRWRFDQTGGVQTDTTFPIEKVGSREDQIRGVARDRAAYRMA